MKKELQEISEKLSYDFYEPDGSTYKFKGSGKIEMDMTVRAKTQEEAQEMADEVLTKGIDWAIHWTREDINCGNFHHEFDHLRNADGESKIEDINADGPYDFELKFISKDEEDHKDNRMGYRP